jgi:hypothetical protein
MNDHHLDDEEPVVAARVRASDLLLTIGNLTAKVEAGTAAAQRTELAVSDQGRRLGHVEAELAGVKATIAAVQAEQTRAQADVDAHRPKPVSWSAYVAIVIAALAVLVPLLVDAYRT